MAPKPKFQIPENITFTPVTESFKVAGGARRLPPQGVLEETGALELNAEASDGLDHIADLEQAGRHYAVHYQASEEHRLVEIKIATDATIKGQMGTRRSTDGSRLYLHLGNVFARHPGLRPDSSQRCKVVVEEEQRRLILVLQGANTKRKKATRTEGGQETGKVTAKGTRSSRKRKGEETPAPAAQTTGDEQQSSAPAPQTTDNEQKNVG